MRYIAALDYDHLDNGVFLTTLARSLSQQQENKDVRPIIIHSDSEYTERIIQTGVMRDEATVRSVKDLNKRLVALMADQGVSTIGINPYRRNFITLKDGKLNFDHDFFNTLPQEPVLLFSTLVQDLDQNQKAVLDLPTLAAFLYDELEAEHLFIFSKADEAEIFTNSSQKKELQWDSMDANFKEKQIPDDFAEFTYPVELTTARDFNKIPELDHTITISAPNS